MPLCPRCQTEIQPDWDWCHSCGFDPEGKMPSSIRAEGASQRPAAPSFSSATSFSAMSTPSPAPATARPESGGSGSKRNVIIVAVVVVVLLPILGFAVLSMTGSTTDKAASTTTAAPTTTEPPWVTVSAPDGSFTLDFPQDPGPAADLGDSGGAPVITSAHVFDLDAEEFEYAMAYFDISPEYGPALAAQNDDLLKDLSRDIVHRLGGTVIDFTYKDFNGVRALEIQAKSEDGYAFGRGLSYLNRSRLHVFLVLAEPSGQYDFTKFIDSFHPAAPA